MSDEESVRELLQRWESGDEAAAEAIFRLYSQRLCALAATQIGERLARRVGPEDIAQSVLRTFFRRTRDGQFTIDHSRSLWRLLVMITINKVRRHGAARRNVNAEVYLDEGDVQPQSIAHRPTPLEAAILGDEFEQVLAGLEGEEPEILRLRLDGYSAPEIANRLDCSRWTVRRVLNRIGHKFEERFRKTSDS